MIDGIVATLVWRLAANAIDIVARKTALTGIFGDTEPHSECPFPHGPTCKPPSITDSGLAIMVEGDIERAMDQLKDALRILDQIEEPPC